VIVTPRWAWRVVAECRLLASIGLVHTEVVRSHAESLCPLSVMLKYIKALSNLRRFSHYR